MTESFVPKGGMCMVCQNKGKDCSGLVFHLMKPIDRYGTTTVVKCIKFVQEKQSK